MFLKKIIVCLLAFFATTHSMEVSEATQQHMELCYNAIKNNQVKKLHELLAAHKFFNQYVIVAHNEKCRRFDGSIFTDYYCKCKLHDPLQVAIHEGKVPCIRLIAYLRGKIHKKFSNTSFTHPCYLLDLYRYRKLFSEKELFSLTRAFLDNKIAKIDEYYTNDLSAYTPLHQAPTAAIAEYLIQQGASVNSMSKYHCGDAIPLMCFAHSEQSESLRETSILLCLLKYDAQVNLVNNAGDTALHWAARVNCLNHIKLLMDYDADPLFKNQKGQFPSEKAPSEKLMHSTTASIQLMEQYPRIALIAKSFDIDPFKYKYTTDHKDTDLFEPSKYTHANTAMLLHNRELTGRKHSYQGYKNKKLTSEKSLCPTLLE